MFTRQAGGGGTDAVLTTHKPGKTAQGTVPAVPGTTYDVTVRQVNGTTFPVGSMEVKGDEPVVTIAPTSGAVDTPFTITDTGGRIQQGDVAIFTPQGGDPATAGIATNGTISADGTTFDGTVPDSITTTGQFFVRVTPAGDQPGRFADLPFFVT